MKVFFVLTAAVAMVMAAPVFADTAAQTSNMTFGVQAGSSFGNVSTTGLDSRTGLAGGVNLNYGLNNIFSVQPELNFVMKGYSLTVLNVTDTAKFNEIEIPLLVKAQYDMGGWSPFVFAGPSIGFAITKSTDNGTTSTAIAGAETLDFGLQFGAGVQVPVAANTDVFVNGRYELGLTNMAGTGTDSKLHEILVLAGVTFNI